MSAFSRGQIVLLRVDNFTKHLTEEEKKSGIFFSWEYTSRRAGRE